MRAFVSAPSTTAAGAGGYGTRQAFCGSSSWKACKLELWVYILDLPFPFRSSAFDRSIVSGFWAALSSRQVVAEVARVCILPRSRRRRHASSVLRWCTSHEVRSYTTALFVVCDSCGRAVHCRCKGESSVCAALPM